MEKLIRIYLTLLLSFAFTFVNGQINQFQGKHSTKHFSQSDFSSAGQIWNGLQNSQGVYIFGNSQDIISFNGVEWSRIQTDFTKINKKDISKIKGSYVSATFISSKKEVFIGREDNFGKLSYSARGEYMYQPIYLATEESKLGKIWSIYETADGSIIFIGERKIVRYKNGVAKVMQLPADFSGFISRTSIRYNNGAIIGYQSEGEYSLREYKALYLDFFNEKFAPIELPEMNSEEIGEILTASGESLKEYNNRSKNAKSIRLNMRGSFTIQGKDYLVTISNKLYEIGFQNGIVKLKASTTNFAFLNYSENPSHVFQNGEKIYLSTSDKGLVVANKSGAIERVYDFEDGLENINCNYTFLDQNKNTWLCLDNGIQFLENGTAVSQLKKQDGFIDGPIESLTFFNDRPYIAMHNDIHTTVNNGTHTSIKRLGLEEQTFYDFAAVKTSDGEKFITIGYDGIYEITDNGTNTVPISNDYAFVFIKQQEKENELYFTLEKGLAKVVYSPSTKKWRVEKILENLGDETHSACYFNGKLIIGINSLGVLEYTIATKKSVMYRKQNYKKENFSYEIALFKNKVYVGSEDGLHTLNTAKLSLDPIPQNSFLFPGKVTHGVHRLLNIDDNELWIISHKEDKLGLITWNIQYLEIINGVWKNTFQPLSAVGRNLINSACIGPNNTIWLGGYDALFIIDRNLLKKKLQPIKVIVSHIDFQTGKGFKNIDKASEFGDISYRNNSFKVHFYCSFYSIEKPNLFRYKLEGFDDSWSEWLPQTEANYVKVPEGTYSLQIQAKNVYGQESEVYSKEIHILPPWYRSIWSYIIYALLGILAIFGIIRLATLRIKQQNNKLETVVKERTSEIAEQNQQLEVQKGEIEKKTMDVLDSIHYAKRIQDTILPARQRLDNLFDDHFIYYVPKDIVSGDFYWARAVENKVIFSAIDCTGHGVPGALVSIVGNNGLLRSINEFKLTSPSDILDKLREIVINAFKSESSTDVKDGMDIALCTIDKSTGILQYAGANNECVIIRNGEIIELKADKQPIGTYIDMKPFTVKEIQLEIGDRIYLYTDGYVDQFGGEKLKKFKSKIFKQMLSELNLPTMKEELDFIQTTFEDWKKHTDQVDDVCVFGVKYNGFKNE